MKIIVSFISVACGIYIGMHKSNYLKNRLLQLGQVYTMIEKIETLINFERLSTSSILKNMSQDENLKNLIFLKDINLEQKNIPVEFKRAVEENSSKMCLNKSDVNMLLRIGQVLGASDVNTQISQFQSLRLMAKNHIQEAQKNYSENGKLYRSLGLLGGVFVAILLV